MSPPGKETGGPLQPPIKRNAPSIYEQDKEAQEQFLREAHRLACESFKTGGEKHFRAFRRHMDGMRNWRGKQALLERVYAATGHPRPVVMYVLFERKSNVRQPRTKKGGTP